MDASAPLVTIPATFFDPRTRISALAMQHVHIDGRTALVYHDAPSILAARPFLSAIAASLLAGLPESHTLGIIETSVPEHDSEPFVYSRAVLSCAAWPGRINAGLGRVLRVDAVAAACGIGLRELQRTECLVLAIHLPRACAFPGFRQLPLGDVPGRVLAVA